MTNDVKNLVRKLCEGFVYGKLAEDKRGLAKYGVKTLIYRLLGLFTAVYGAMNIYTFKNQLTSLPYEIVMAWSLWLLGYWALSQTFLWLSMNDAGHFGEIFVLWLTGIFCWMEGYSLHGHWFLGKPYMKIPEGFFESVMGAFGLLVLSGISSVLRHKFLKK